MRRAVPLSPLRRITLLTDFGTRDGYVAAMRGVIHGIAPLAFVDDASHDIPQGDVHAAAFTLARYARWYPAGTIHVVVVDPGVGTSRRGIAAFVDGHAYVAPDNGVLTRVLNDAADVHIVELAAPELRMPETSRTFHGRDIFAPAAAHLAAGVGLDHFGPAVANPVLLHIPEPEREEMTIRGEVVYVDRFGNLITNIPRDWITSASRVSVGLADVGTVRSTYGDVDSGDTLALIGSDGMLEIAVRDGSAADALAAGVGAAVAVEPQG